MTPCYLSLADSPGFPLKKGIIGSVFIGFGLSWESAPKVEFYSNFVFTRSCEALAKEVYVATSFIPEANAGPVKGVEAASLLNKSFQLVWSPLRL